jgi:hypothetical protein
LIIGDDATDSGLLSKIIGKASISHTEGLGGDTVSVPDIYGSTLKVGNKILLTKYNGGGITLDAGAAPESLIFLEVNGRPLQFKPSTTDEVPFFKSTVAKYTTPESVTALESGRNILNALYTSGIDESTLPAQLSITSEAIPDRMKDATLSAIKNTAAGDVEIGGSASTQNQIGDFLGRSVHDLELYSDNATNTINAVMSEYQSQGFVEGKDYRQVVDKQGNLTNQIEYPTDNGDWDIGIEVATGTHADMGYGIKPTNPVLIDDVKNLSAIENAGRKYDASNILTGGTKTSDPILSARMGRNLKHTVDFVDIATQKGVKKTYRWKMTLLTMLIRLTRYCLTLQMKNISRHTLKNSKILPTLSLFEITKECRPKPNTH